MSKPSTTTTCKVTDDAWAVCPSCGPFWHVVVSTTPAGAAPAQVECKGCSARHLFRIPADETQHFASLTRASRKRQRLVEIRDRDGALLMSGGPISLAEFVADMIASEKCFEFAELPGIDLRSSDLRHAELSGANLERADFRGANLEGARFAGANLRGARFDGATMKLASLHMATLRGATLRRCTATNADFEGADLRDANLRHADLRRARFTFAADLRRADFRGADLRAATFNAQYRTGARFEGARLAGASISGLLAPDSDILLVSGGRGGSRIPRGRPSSTPSPKRRSGSRA